MINENTPTLMTDRLVLRRFTKADARALLRILGDDEVNTYLPWFPLRSLAEAEAFLAERYLSYYDKPSAYRYAICLRNDNRPIGYVGLNDHASHDLGYWLAREHWHKGIVTEAARAVVARIGEAGYPYITATHDIHNPHSGGVMRNLGMLYKYSYVERVKPKDELVTFRMYQLNLNGDSPTYTEYRDKYEDNFVETDL